MSKEIKEAIELLEKAKRQLACTLDKQHYTAYTQHIDQALTKLREAPEPTEKSFLICPKCGKTFPLFMDIEFGSHVAGCKAPEQPPAGDFTKRFRDLIKLSEDHLSDNKIGRLQTYGKEACDIIETETQRADKAEAREKDLAILNENVVNSLAELEAKLKDLEASKADLLTTGEDLLSVLGENGYFPAAGKPKTDAFKVAIAKAKKEG